MNTWFSDGGFMAAITLWLAVQAGVSLYFMGMDIYERFRNWLHWRRNKYFK